MYEEIDDHAAERNGFSHIFQGYLPPEVGFVLVSNGLRAGGCESKVMDAITATGMPITLIFII
jgi:hypothetical protein